MAEDVPIRVIAGSESWIEGDAVAQLEGTARLPGMLAAIGLPDLHPGRGTPIGAAFVSERIYPHLVGNDIGCGVSLWRTDVRPTRFHVKRVAAKLNIDGPWDGDATEWMGARGVEPTDFAASAGTIGAGNHFAEVQRVVEVRDAEVVAGLGLSEETLVLAVHSGSRGLGESILRRHVAVHRAEGLASKDATEYLHDHDNAVKWGVANRELIAHRLGEALGTVPQRVIDLTHNSVVPCEWKGLSAWLHRKGAAPSNQGPVIIPGSRGTPTYLVAPTGDQREAAWSVAHGAGRKWTRTYARERLGERGDARTLKRTELGGVVICEDKTLLLEEAPQAYKNVDRVVDDLVEAGLVSVAAVLHPVLTYKTADGSGPVSARERRERERKKHR